MFTGRNQGRSSTGAVAHSAVSPPGDPAYAVLASGPFAGIPVQASAAGSVAASAYASRLTGASVRSSFNGAPADSGTELPTLWAGMGSAQPAASAAWWPQSSADWVRTEQFSAGPAAAAASFGAAGPLPTAAPAWGSGGPARAAEPAQHLPGAAGALSAGAHSNGGLLEHGGVEGLTGSLGRIAQSASAAASAARGAAAGMRQAAGTGMVDGQGSVAQPPGALPAQERPADAAVEWSAAQGLMPQAAGTQSAEAHGPVPQPANPLPAPERRAAAAVGRPPAPQGPAVQPAAGQPAAAAQAAEAQAAPAGQPCKAQPAALHAAMAQPAPLRPADTQLPDSMGQPAALQGAGAQRAPAPPAVAQPAAVQAAAACATEAQPAVPLPGLPQPAALAPLIEAGPAAAAAPPAAAAAARSAAQPATQSIIEDAPQAVAEPLAASALPAAAVAAPSASPALAAAPVGGMQHAASSNMGSGEAEPEAVIGADTSAPVMETAAGPMARMQYGGSTDMGSGEAEIEAEVDAVTSALGRAAAGRSSGAGLAAAPSFDAWDPAWRGGAGGAAADKNGAPWREPRASREDPYSYLGAAQGGGWPYAQACPHVLICALRLLLPFLSSTLKFCLWRCGYARA